MHRTTISIDEPELAALQRIAAERGISVSALIREAIGEKIDRCEPADGPAAKTAEHRRQPMPKSMGIGRSSDGLSARELTEARAPAPPWR